MQASANNAAVAINAINARNAFNANNREGAHMSLQRVRKADAVRMQQGQWQQPDGTDICLACWQDYMRCDDRDLGISQLRLRGGEDDPNRAASESDPYVAQRLADLAIGAATDAMIDSLPRLYIWAIYKAHGIGQVWNFPQADWVATLAEARAALTEKLKKNVATRVKF
jgi:hypothetical protein